MIMLCALVLVVMGLGWLCGSMRELPAGFMERYERFLVGLALLAVGLLLMTLSVHAYAATEHADSVRAPAPVVRVPDASALYRHWVEQAAADTWGIGAPVARIAAQIHQESRWNPKARSPVGAEGLAQFMPATGRWLADKFAAIGAYDPWDPRWSARAVVAYDDWLLQRNAGADACANWAFALSAYNGGEVRLHHEQAAARRAGKDPRLWFANTARYRDRSGSAWAENRGYVRRILTVLEPAYIDAGWSGEAVCHV